MGFLGLSLRNLLRHRTRTVLTVLGIAASVAALFSILSFNRGFEKGLSRELERTGLHFMVVPSGCAHEVAALVLHGAVIPKFLDMSVIGKIRDIAEIEFISPLVVAQIPNPRKNRVDLMYGIEMSRVRTIKPSWEIEGFIPAADSEIMVGSEVAAHYGIKPGGRIAYQNFGREFTVTGIVKKTGSQDDAFLYFPLKTAQEILKRPSAATAIGIRVKNPEDVLRIVDVLTEKVPGIQIVTMNQVLNSIGNLAASAKALSLSLALIAAIVSAFGVMNAILMTVFERTPEIGMMRAVGASRTDVFRMVLNETILLSLAGGLTGLLISAAGNDLIEAFVRGFMPYVPSGEMIGFEVGLALAILFATLGAGILSGLYPAWRASRVSPLEAIKA